MKILLAASEFSPLARTGGLGEAVAGIARALVAAGHEVSVILPRYRHLQSLGTEAGSLDPAKAIYHHEYGGAEVLLVDDPAAFDREGIYGDSPGEGYDDQWWRFARFSAVVRSISKGYDVVHLHDAHAGLAALDNPSPTVFTIHNSAYGIFGPLAETATLAGVDDRHLEPEAALEWWGQASFLKAGAVGADRVTTVSPSFARQLTTDGSVSGGLDGVLRALPHPVAGIVNGLHPGEWDPRSDPAVTAPFTPNRPFPRKATRAALLGEAGLSDGVVFGNVGRMAEQKGLHLLDPSIDLLVEEGLRLVLVGDGELNPMVDAWAERHPKAVWHAPYEERLSRVVSAGADFYLMPSRFEPCGIGQMYAMRYGAPPVVRFTGGLEDTVIDLDESPADATGFGFREFRPEELVKTVRRAMRIFRRSRAEYRRLQRNGMLTDFSWGAAVQNYLATYDQAVTYRRERSGRL
ncbi:MAG: glycogen synthase [Acidimicrobiia bacterium]